MTKLIKSLIINVLGALSICLSLLFWPSTASARTYQITESELTQLEWNLSELSKINKANQLELVELKSELRELKRENEAQQSLLLKANQSLSEYEREVNRKQARIKRQRTLAYCFLAVTAFYAVRAKL